MGRKCVMSAMRALRGRASNTHSVASSCEGFKAWSLKVDAAVLHHAACKRDVSTQRLRIEH